MLFVAVLRFKPLSTSSESGTVQNSFVIALQSSSVASATISLPDAENT
jgi:phage terminase large subunit-like protein